MGKCPRVFILKKALQVDKVVDFSIEESLLKVEHDPQKRDNVQFHSFAFFTTVYRDHSIESQNTKRNTIVQVSLIVYVSQSNFNSSQISPGLPKTRSGKIMRRILRSIAANRLDKLGDVSTLADPEVVNGLIHQHEKLLDEIERKKESK